MIGIINYKAGNSQSVKHALDALHIPSSLISTSKDIETATRLILPGVGSAQATLESLHELGIVDALRIHAITQKKPFLGICIGQQLLFSHSEEGHIDCFGWIPGQVKRFDNMGLQVPQIGWNKVVFTQSDHPLLSGISNPYFYFVNSYYVVPDDPNTVFGQTDYGLTFASSIQKDNIFATQFHVEKSGPSGLKLLENFAKWT